MNLDVSTWKEFKLEDVFWLKGGFYNKKPEHSKEGRIPFLASTESNNGVTEFYCIEDIKSWDKVGNEDNTLDKKMYDGNCIAVTVNGSVCNAFYQKEQFTCSHDITAFYLKYYDMNPEIAMFLCTIITKDKYRWSYGRKPHDVKKFGKSVIKLPVSYNSDGTILIDRQKMYSEKGYVPDWKFMENYIKSLHYKPLTTQSGISNEMTIGDCAWRRFVFGTLIDKIYKGTAINKDGLTCANDNCGIRYITRTSDKNGCELLASVKTIKKECIEAGNAITIGDTTATCFYQDEPFITGDHMVVIRAEWLNIYTGLFVVTLLNKERYRYNYGRAYVMDKIKNTVLELPAKKKVDGYVPDWELIENYMKSLPYGDRL